MNETERRRHVRELVEEFGLDDEDAAFAVRFAAGETMGDVQAVTLPMPAAEARRQAALLVEQHGFTPDEAARYVAGDRTAIETAVTRRRGAKEPAAANEDLSTRAFVLGAG